MKRRVLLTLLVVMLLLVSVINPGVLAQKPSDQPVEPAEGETAVEQPPDPGRYRAPAPAPEGAGTLAVTYTYTNTTPVAIPDSSCPAVVTSTITVPDSFSIGDLNVGLWIEHTWRGDLDMYLMGPDATTVELYTDPDGSADNINALLDDSSPNAADSTNHNAPPPYYYAWWRPEGNLADFNGKNAQGDWTLQLCDDASGDVGTLQTWTLFFQSGLILKPASQSGSVCKGSDVVYTFEVVNATAATTAFDLAYSSVWPTYGPAATPVLAPGESWQFDVTVHIPWSVSSGDQDTLTVTVSGAGDSDQATATTTAGMVLGYQDYTDAPRPVRDHGVVYWDGKIYKIGGYDGGYQAYLDIYDIATDTWSQGADIPDGRDYWDCDPIDAKIYCAGGYNAGGKTELYIYDIGTNTWSTGAPLPEYRYTFASVALGGKYYVIGGYGPSPYYKDTIWAYDPGTDIWDTTLTPMSTGRRYHFAGVIGGKIYVAGGYNGSYLDSAEVYDPVANTWTPVASMPSTWLRGGDAVKHDRYLLIFGGDDNSSATASDFALIYDALTDSWNWLPNMLHQLYATEADGDGSDVWISSGRLYEGGTYRYSEYHTRLLQCPSTCDPISAADFSWDPDPGWAGLDITFTGVATGTPAIQYEWDFGDGNTGLGEVVAHAYGDAGIYTVVMTATNCDGIGQIVVSHDVQVILPPTVDVMPDSLSASQCPDEITTQDLLICNLGDADLEWSLHEVSPTMRVAAVPAPVGNPAPAAPVTERPVITSKDQCAAYETYAGVEPVGYAEFCMDYTPTPWVSEELPLAPTDIGYAQDIGYISDNFVTFVLNDFPGQTILGTNTNAYYGVDFDPTATTLYALNDTTDELGTIDLADGTFTGLVPCVPPGAPPNDLWTGLTIDPSTGTFYASDPTDLYIIDPATGNYTLVGPFNSGGSMIEIAMNPDGEMYGHDIGTDSIYQIDPTTGAATLIGPTGYAANYAQGMDFDNDDGTLYIFLYIGSGANVYGTVDLLTGAVSPLAIDNPLGEFEGATQTTKPYVDIPWLSEDPISGTVSGQDCATVTVSFDSSGMEPGDYFAGLLIESNDPATPEVSVPVTMTVLAPVEIVSVIYVITDLQVAFDATVTGTEPIAYEWDFGDGTTSNEEDPVHVYAEGGCYTVVLSATNVCGLATWSEEICVCEPVYGADFQWWPPTPMVEETVSFTATVEGGTPPFTYTWDFGDGGTGDGASATHTYAAVGDYGIDLTVDNACGESTAKYTITVVAACEPVAGVDFYWSPAVPLVGETVSFTATVMTGTLPLTFTWDFGDGATGEGRYASHAYSAADMYTVILTVDNPCGQATMQYPVTVEAGLRYIYLPIVVRDQ